MDERRLTELLRLVDDPIDEPSDTEFKMRLRLDLDEMLMEQHDDAPGAVVRISRPEVAQPRRHTTWLLAAAAVIAAVVGAVVLVARRDDPAPIPADQPVPTTTAATTTTVAALTDPDLACERYVAAAEPVDALSSFARRPSSSVPDLAATEGALRQLAIDAAAGAFADAGEIGALELAAGALGEAEREIEAGDVGSASSSVQLAVLTLTDLRRSDALASCFP